LNKDEPEFQRIVKYAANTHSPYHKTKIEIKNVFKVESDEEKEKFKELPNRKLLWHGSKTSNFAGILSQGLRIAPMGVPQNGNMVNLFFKSNKTRY
jgi:poly [ADP-ribose] polymerase